LFGIGRHWLFPEGVEDSELSLLKVRVERAEYWDSQAVPCALGLDREKRWLKAYGKLNPGEPTMRGWNSLEKVS
jgi:hypothetical protein